MDRETELPKLIVTEGGKPVADQADGIRRFKEACLAQPIGKHLAALNLFREADGKVYITVASARGAIAEIDEKGKTGAVLPIDYVHALILEAAATTVPQRTKG